MNEERLQRLVPGDLVQVDGTHEWLCVADAGPWLSPSKKVVTAWSAPTSSRTWLAVHSLLVTTELTVVFIDSNDVIASVKNKLPVGKVSIYDRSTRS